jgi:diguanylate cyclase (GGDEF)-like protein
LDEGGPPLAVASHSGLWYWQALTRAALAAAGVHLAFTGLFLVFDTPALVWANLASVAVYGCIYRLLQRQHGRLAVLLLWAEMLLHTLVATVVVGWDGGFHYYLLVVMPLVFVSPRRTLRTKLLLGATLAGYYIGLDACSRLYPPAGPITTGALDLVRYVNIVATFGLLAYLAHYYFGAVLRAERRLHDLATTDALTGLANRRRVMQVASQQLGRRRRDGTPLSFVLGDVDHFKAVNDRHGHDTGDRVLMKVAGAMKAATREADTVSRWGGEEFLVVLPETDIATALRVAERMRESVRQIVVMRTGQPVSVTITLGVSSLRDGESIEDAIARADAAMYQGKIDGRNRSVAETLH